jgi:hypothetical protein
MVNNRVVLVIVVYAFSFLIFGCIISEGETENAVETFKENYSDIFQFLIEQDEYDAVHLWAKQAPGGRWSRLTLALVPGQEVERDAFMKLLKRRFEENEWGIDSECLPLNEKTIEFYEGDPKKLPSDSPVFYYRGPRDNPATASNDCYIYVSPDCGEMIIYIDEGR